MRFAGRISADKVGQVKVGQTVSFRINGYSGQDFRGRVIRLDPSANDITRQVEVQVAFVDGAQPRVAGLYAEGNIETTKVAALTLPESALVKAGDKTSVWRIKDNKLVKSDIAVGPRDARTGHYEIRSGLSTADAVMRTPSSSFKDGQDVEMVASRPAASAPAAAASAAKGA
jgi:multidrug efflux pump subunit AcrA (membrane-fusion protein)